MYDALRSRYTFSCPGRGEASVTLSAFRRLEHLPGTAHPAVFSIDFACVCGHEHPALVAHDDLDWAPLGLGAGGFLDLMTARAGAVADELADLSARRIQRGEWPWTFFCYPEGRARPVYPSAFRVLAPSGRRDVVALAVRCPGCGCLSVNVVSAAHLDLPFHHDREVGVLEHVFEADRESLLDRFVEELRSASFDSHRLEL